MQRIKISKAELLARLQADRQLLLKMLDDIPDEALDRAGATGSWSAMDVLAHITAWDGEALRRIAFASGESSQRPHALEDEAYWQEWNQRQVALKRLLGPRGVKVDMAGAWLRLLARIEALSPPDYARWLEGGSGIRLGHDIEHGEQLRCWRVEWERSLPWRQRWLRWLGKKSNHRQR